jgi:hypothetical protein
MADKKISALTSASTPLAGTEVLPIVQSGATVQVSVANLTAGRAVGSAGGTFTDNFVQGTAAKGVNFTANTPQAGMTSQLLNWYEEGTFTPTLSGATTTTYTTQTGRYTRVGRLVTFQCELEINSLGNGSTTTFVLGTLPNAGHFSTISLGFFSSIASSVTFLTGYINNGANSVTMQSLTAAGASSASNAIFGNSARIIVSGQYSV